MIGGAPCEKTSTAVFAPLLSANCESVSVPPGTLMTGSAPCGEIPTFSFAPVGQL